VAIITAETAKTACLGLKKGQKDWWKWNFIIKIRFLDHQKISGFGTVAVKSGKIGQPVL
jgi:hypothetical protein